MILRFRPHQKQPFSFQRLQRQLWRGSYALVAILMVVASIVAIQPTAKADQYDDKIAALQADINRYEAQANELSAQAASLQNTLDQLRSQSEALQAQIDLNQQQYNQLSQQIKDTEKKIQESQDALGDTIASLYIDGKVSPIEMLASSKNVSDYLDKQEYRTAIRDELTSTIKTIKQLKQELSDKQAQVAKVLEEQKVAQANLQDRQNQQQALITQTNNDEAAYQGLIANSQSQIDQARRIQAALATRSNTTGGYNLIEGGLLSSYITSSAYGSWNNSTCPIVYTYMSSGGVDGNGSDGRGYGCRQCASYVAWKINQTKGYWPSWGNAYDFQYHGTIDDGPHAGDVGVLTSGGQPGHVAWVETDPYVSNTGSLAGKPVIQISQYNFNYGQGYGMYSVMEVSVNFFNIYIRP